MCATSPCTCTGRLQLHDIRDTHAFCSNIARTAGSDIPPTDHEDLIADLVAYTWRLATTYKPGPSPFSIHATVHARRRVHDWRRRQYGRTRWQWADRTYERPIPTIIPLDDQLVESQRRSTMDPAEHLSADLERVLTQGHSRRPRLADLGRRRSARRAA